MKKFVIDDQWQFEKTVARLHRFHEAKQQTLSDATLSEEDRAWRVLNDDRMILHLRCALREYLVSCAEHDALLEERLWNTPDQTAEPQPELARAA